MQNIKRSEFKDASHTTGPCNYRVLGENIHSTSGMQRGEKIPNISTLPSPYNGVKHLNLITDIRPTLQARTTFPLLQEESPHSKFHLWSMTNCLCFGRE